MVSVPVDLMSVLSGDNIIFMIIFFFVAPVSVAGAVMVGTKGPERLMILVY